MNEFTKGEFEVHSEKAYVIPAGDEAIACPICAMLWPTNIRGEDETFANAELIAAAFTAMTKLDALGYDAMAVLDELPGIVSTFEITAREQAEPGSLVAALLARIRPEATEQPERVCMECGAEMDRFEDRDGGGWSCPNVQCGCIETDDMEDQP